MLATIGNLAFQLILYLTLVYFFLDIDGNIVESSLETVVMETEHRAKLSAMAT